MTQLKTKFEIQHYSSMSNFNDNSNADADIFSTKLKII